MKILGSIVDFVRRSLARKLVVAVVLIYCGLALTVAVSLGRKETAFEQLRLQRAEGLAEMLAMSGQSRMLADDHSGLQELVIAAAKTRAHRYSMYLDASGRVLAHSSNRHVGQELTDPRAVSLRSGPATVRLIAMSDYAVDIAAPIMVDRRLIGWARVSIDMSDLQANMMRLRRQAIGITIVAFALGIFLISWIASSVTRRVEDLSRVCDQFRAGRRDVKVVVRGVDEVAEASRGVNEMLEAVTQSERSLQDAQRIAGLGSWCYDSDSDRAEWSPEMFKTYGLDPAGPPPSLDQALTQMSLGQQAEIKKLLENPDDGVSSFNLTVKRPDGCERICWVEVRTERKENGRQVLYGISQDITDREAAAAQLRQAQKMEAVGQLTGGLAHDFNNLLAIAIGNLDLANARLGEGTIEREAVEEALAAALRGSELTRRLLAFSRLQPLAIEAVSLNALIADFEPLCQHTVGANIEVRSRLIEDLWTAKVDPSQVESAILNLVINARDAMPDGGTLTIETHNASVDTQGTGLGSADDETGRYAVISVSDTGHGMSRETAEKACEPFFTTKSAGAGTGLGLSMVYGFAKQSGGDLKIDSALGHGTTMSIYLPVSEGQSPAVRPEANRAMPAAAGERILVVEDEERVRRIVGRQLSDLGYFVKFAGSGAEALAALGQDQFDLLFTDVVMPGGMNGVQLAQRAQILVPGQRVLFTSGFTQAAALPSGAGSSLLSKPYRKMDLAVHVRRALDNSPLDAAAA